MHSFWGLDTVLAEQSMMDELLIWVQMIQHNICIAGVAGCEHNHFKILSEILHNVNGMRSDVNPSFDDVACWEDNGELDIVRGLQILIAVNQSLI